jgi:hypothetical protein
VHFKVGSVFFDERRESGRIIGSYCTNLLRDGHGISLTPHCNAGYSDSIPSGLDKVGGRIDNNVPDIPISKFDLRDWVHSQPWQNEFHDDFSVGLTARNKKYQCPISYPIFLTTPSAVTFSCNSGPPIPGFPMTCAVISGGVLPS